MPQQHLTQPLSLASNPSFFLNAKLPNHGNGPPQSLFCNPFNAESLVDSKFSQSIFPKYGNLNIPTDSFSKLFCPGGNDIPPAPSASTYQTSAEGDGQRARYEVMENADNLHVAEPTLIEDSRLRDGYVAIEGGYICTFPHCKVKHVFKRRFELQRHMLIHAPKKSFDCPVDSCNRRGRHTFYRDDKRKAHLKSRHTDDDYATCPVSGCPAGPLQLDLLRLHLSFHGRFFNSDTVKLLKTYAEGGQKCPMQKCRQKRWLSSDQLAGKKGHLVSHNEADRISQASTLREKGFGIQGEVICPMCGTPSSDTADFCTHMENEHILTEHGKGHAAEVRFAGSDLFYKHVFTRLVWNMGLDHRDFLYGKSYSCPHCSFQQGYGVRGDLRKAHLGLLRPSEELYPYRRQILRLWPGFGSHPVFDDLRRTTLSTA